MVAAPVVEYDVLHHFQAVGVRGFHELLVLLIGAVARVNLVAVRHGIAVVAGFGHVVFDDRRGPDGRGPQLLKIGKVVLNASQVAAVAGVHRIAGHVVDAGTLHYIVLRVAVGEPVGHQHVHEVGLGEALRAVGVGVAGTQLVGVGEAFAAFEAQFQLAGLSIWADGEIDDEVVGAFQLLLAFERHAGVGGQGGGAACNAGRIHQQLQFGVFHAHPPISRVDAHGGRGLGDSGNIGKRAS